MNGRLRQCLTGGHDGKPKRAFRTQAEADRWLAGSKLEASMVSYPCGHCHNYHIGHPRDRK